MNARLLSFIYGIVFAAVGLFGFTPNPLVSYHGFFETDAVHNGVHVLTGGIFVAGALMYPGHGTLLLKVMGLAGFAVTAVGFLTEGGMMLGFIRINEADRWLHLGLALVVFGSGWIFGRRKLKVYLR
ncbi:MAG: DUF4383 domain-containing protein [Gammaproteobacteria bacterium]